VKQVKETQKKAVWGHRYKDIYQRKKHSKKEKKAGCGEDTAKRKSTQAAEIISDKRTNSKPTAGEERT